MKGEILVGVDVTKRFGGLVAVDNVSFKIYNKEIVGLIGPNGAGKTTLFNLITGVYRPDYGSIIFNNQDITGFSPHKICKLGIGRTYQIPKPFKRLSVLENVMCGVIFGRNKRIGFNDSRLEALKILEFVGLKEKSNMLPSNLTVQDLKFLELARALATEPKLILLDEVAAGLNPSEADLLVEKVREINRKLGITIFWVEHVMRVIMNVAERIIVLNYGKKIAEGSPEEISADPKVIEAYLGEKNSVRGEKYA